MADVRVRRKLDHSDIQEMSEYSFELQRHDFELVPLDPGKRPKIVEAKQEAVEETEEPKAEPVKKAKKKA